MGRALPGVLVPLAEPLVNLLMVNRLAVNSAAAAGGGSAVEPAGRSSDDGGGIDRERRLSRRASEPSVSRCASGGRTRRGGVATQRRAPRSAAWKARGDAPLPSLNDAVAGATWMIL